VAILEFLVTAAFQDTAGTVELAGTQELLATAVRAGNLDIQAALAFLE
jgi:hypothetical protein